MTEGFCQDVFNYCGEFLPKLSDLISFSEVNRGTLKFVRNVIFRDRVAEEIDFERKKVPQYLAENYLTCMWDAKLDGEDIKIPCVGKITMIHVATQDGVVIVNLDLLTQKTEVGINVFLRQLSWSKAGQFVGVSFKRGFFGRFTIGGTMKRIFKLYGIPYDREYYSGLYQMIYREMMR